MKSFLLLIFLSITLIGTAQISVSEGFESGILPTGWTTENVMGVVNTDISCEGSYSVRANISTTIYAIIYTSSYTSNGGTINVSYKPSRGVGLITANLLLYYELNQSGNWVQIANIPNSSIINCPTVGAVISAGTIPNGDSVRFRLQINRTINSQSVPLVYFDNFNVSQDVPPAANSVIASYPFNNSYNNSQGFDPFSTPSTAFSLDRFSQSSSALLTVGPTSAMANYLPLSNNPRSISLWFFKSTNNSINLFKYGTNGAGQTFGCYTLDNNFYFQGFASDLNFGGSALNDSWTHVVVTYSGTQIKMYINGVQLGNAQNYSCNTGGSAFTLGHPNTTIVYDDLNIYNYELTQNQISNLFNFNSIVTVTPAPEAVTPQVFCGTSNTVANLQATGSNLQWYAAQTGGVPLANSVAIVNGNTYYVSQTIDGVEGNRTAVLVNINPVLTPTFTAVAPICSGTTLSALPTTSNNGISGTWSPALNNQATTTYTFTPTAGQCANTQTLTITVNPLVTPTFAAVAPICSGTTLSALPITSNNGISGTWSPALNNQATTTYTFTPTAGQCANTQTLTITVNPLVTPTFTAVAPICSGTTLSALPITSNNGISGTWSPALNNQATTTYTFTPTAGQCANTQTLTITVNPLVTPTFTAVAPICSGTTLSALPTTSINGISGTWSPALNNQATTTYTFTPNSGQCANTQTLTIGIVEVQAPSGESVQVFEEGATLANIVINPSNVFWYATQDDAINNVNALPLNTILDSNTTYYAVSASGECRSNPFPVTVSITLGLDAVVFSDLKVYPNPVRDMLNIETNEIISSVEVYSIQGQKILSSNQTQIDFSNVSAGVYLVKIKSTNQAEITQRIVKN